MRCSNTGRSAWTRWQAPNMTALLIAGRILEKKDTAIMAGHSKKRKKERPEFWKNYCASAKSQKETSGKLKMSAEGPGGKGGGCKEALALLKSSKDRKAAVLRNWMGAIRRRPSIPCVRPINAPFDTCRHNSVRQQTQAVNAGAGMDPYAIYPGP